MQDKEKLKQRLLLAIENSKGFGLQVGTDQILSQMCICTSQCDYCLQ